MQRGTDLSGRRLIRTVEPHALIGGELTEAVVGELDVLVPVHLYDVSVRLRCGAVVVGGASTDGSGLETALRGGNRATRARALSTVSPRTMYPGSNWNCKISCW